MIASAASPPPFLYDVKIGSKLFQNRYGAGVMPVTMTVDVAGEVFVHQAYPFRGVKTDEGL